MAGESDTFGRGGASGASGAPVSPPLSPPRESGLGRELGGDLPCVVCGYNLRGLSIRSMCPECGTNLRATILALVDPLASELRPISFPRLTSAGVVMWAFGAVAVALMSWLPQAADGLRMLGVSISRPSAGLGVMLGLGTSALGAFALIRPHAGILKGHSLMAALATLLYAPLGWLLWRYHGSVDRGGGQRYLTGWAPTVVESYTLAGAGALIACIILLMRPNARVLVARSMVMRTGRVDRQTLFAMAIASLIMSTGALFGLAENVPHASSLRDVARSVGVLLIAFGGVMLTIGTLGSLLDCARIAGAILIPKATVRQVIREGRSHARSRLMSVIDPIAAPHTDANIRPPTTPPGSPASPASPSTSSTPSPGARP